MLPGAITGGAEHVLLAAIARLEQSISHDSDGWSEEYRTSVEACRASMVEAYDVLCRVRAEGDRVNVEEESRQHDAERTARRDRPWSTRY